MLYSSLAAIYDRVMAHVDYEEWVMLLLRAVEKHGARSGRRVFEIGGGTGMLGALLEHEGFAYHGSDRSAAMCREALRRGVPSVCTDGRALPVRGPFDIVLFLYDGINYLATAADYRELFAQVRRVLAPGGLFLFDITTEANSRRYFQDTFDTEDYGDAAYIRHSYFDQIAKIQHNDFVIFMREPGAAGLFRRSDERHAQRVFPAATIRSWVPAELFDVAGVWDGYSMRPCSRSSERVHFLLKARETA